MSETKNSEGSALRRIVKLPLVSSTLQMVTGMYVGAKHRYPLLGIVGGMTELSVRSFSMAASQRAAPFLQRLEPEIETVNGYALVGLEQLEKTFPIFHQSADEVIEYMKESFFLRLEDAQYRVNVELDNMADRWQKVLKFTWDVLEAAQASAAGQVLTSGLDELLTRSEEAVAYNLPLPPTLWREWEIRVQSYEDEDGNEDDDDDGEPRMWTRIRSLLFYLYLQMYHRFLLLKERVDSVLEFLGEAADVVGLTGLLEGVWSLLQLLLSLYTTQVQRVEALGSLLVGQFSEAMKVLKELPPVQQLLNVPAQVRSVRDDLLELGQILIQLLINTTPLYDLVQQASDQNMTDFDLPDGASRRSSGNSLFLKAMDGRPRRRRSLYARYRRSFSSGSSSNLAPSLSPAPSPSPATASTPVPAPAPSLSPALAPVPAPNMSEQDPVSDPDQDPAEAQDQILDQDPIEAEDEVPDPEPTKAKDKFTDVEPTEAQVEPKALDGRKGSLKKDGQPARSLELNASGISFTNMIRRRSSAYEVPDAEPTEAQDKFTDSEPTEAQVELKAPDGRKGSLKKNGQPAGSLELNAPGISFTDMIRRRSSAYEVPDVELTEAQDKFRDSEPTEAQVETKAPDGRKGSLKKDGQPAGSLELNTPATSFTDMIRRCSSAYEVPDSELTETQEKFTDPEQTEAQVEPKAPDGRKGSLKKNGQPAGSLELNAPAISFTDMIRRRSSAYEVPDAELTEAQDKFRDSEPTEAQIEPKAPDGRKGSLKKEGQPAGSLELNAQVISFTDMIRRRSSAYEVPDAELTEAQDKFTDSEPSEAQVEPKAPDGRKGSLKKNGQPAGSLELNAPAISFTDMIRRRSSAYEVPDAELTEAQDKFTDSEPTEAQVEPKAPDGRKGSLKKDGQPAGSLELNAPATSFTDMIRRRSSAYEVPDSELTEAKDKFTDPEQTEAQVETKAPDGRKGSLKKNGQPAGSLELNAPGISFTDMIQRRSSAYEVPDAELTEAQDKFTDSEPTEAQVEPKAPDGRKGSLKKDGQPAGSLELNAPGISFTDMIRRRSSAYEVPDSEPSEAQDKFTDSEPSEAQVEPKAPDGRKGSLKKNGQPAGSLELNAPAISFTDMIRRRSSAYEVPDSELTEAQDKFTDPEQTEAQVEPKAPDGRKGSLKKNGQPAGSLELNAPATSFTDMIRRRSSAYEVPDSELTEAQDKFTDPEPTEAQVEPKALDGRKGSLKKNGQPAGSLELNAPGISFTNMIRRRSSAYEVPDSELTEAQDKFTDPEQTEAQVEPKTPDGRKGSLKKDGQAAGFLELNAPGISFTDMIRRRSSAYEVSDSEPTEAQNKLLNPEPNEVQVESPAKAPDGCEGNLSAGSPELDSPQLSSSNTIRRRSSTREMLFSPIMQFVTQSQRAFEYLSSGSHSDDQITPVVDNREQ